jgi:tRNA A-37 threonylcarbamoyl transferase component Bud32
LKLTCFRIDRTHWELAPGSDPDRARVLIEFAERELGRGARNLKSGRRKELYRFASGPDRPGLLLKVNRYDRGARLLSRLRVSKSRYELEVAVRLAERGVPTPVPVAAGEERRRGLLKTCRLLVPAVEGAADLRHLWLEEPALASERRAWSTALGRLARRLHEKGVFQEDFAPNNFLVHPGDPQQLFAIDFERTRLVRRVRRAARRRMLAKLDRHLLGATNAARMRFLLGYTDGDRRAARRWWGELEAEAPRQARRDLARMRRTATRDGRRFRRIESEGWLGWARHEAPLARLLELAGASSGASSDSGASCLRERGGFWWWEYASLSQRNAINAWATAQILWLRGGQMPRPLALLRRDERTWLFYERPPEALLWREAEGSRRARAAAVILLDRLLALGVLEGGDPRNALALRGSKGGAPRAIWLDAPRLRIGRAERAGRHRRAGALVGAGWASGVGG